MFISADAKVIPQHIKKSKTYYQFCKGTKFIFEEVAHPGNLKDSDFLDKKLFMGRLREIARQTMREELVKVIDIYFKRATIVYIISDLEHNIVGLSMSEASFDNGHQVLLPWLNIYLEEYREKGIYMICVGKSVFHFISEYRRIHNLRGPKKLIPLFKKWFFISRTFNPRIYSSMLKPNMKVSPSFDEIGMIADKSIPKDEREIRIDFLKKLGHKEEDIDERSLFIVKAFSNEKENKEMHANLPLCSEDSVNRFFKNHLGLDKGNLLITTVAFRPCVLVPLELLQRRLRQISRFFKNMRNKGDLPETRVEPHARKTNTQEKRNKAA